MIRVKAGVFSLTPPASFDQDRDYLRWHLLDHMPEQYQLPGIVLGLRWIGDDACRAARLVGDAPAMDVGNLVHYLLGDPVQQTIDDFMRLGRRLAEVGRFPERRTSLGLKVLELLRWDAAPSALVSPEVVPFRPHRGVFVVIEEPTGDPPTAAWLTWLHTDHVPALLGMSGTAGSWMFGSSTAWSLPPAAIGPEVFVTVVYLDGDPVATAAELAPLIEQRWATGAVRPLFAGPLRSMVEWEAWR